MAELCSECSNGVVLDYILRMNVLNSGEGNEHKSVHTPVVPALVV